MTPLALGLDYEAKLRRSAAWLELSQHTQIASFNQTASRVLIEIKRVFTINRDRDFPRLLSRKEQLFPHRRPSPRVCTIYVMIPEI